MRLPGTTWRRAAARRPWLAALGLALACARAQPLDAQTTDPLFAGYSFTPPALGSRPSGMGGAFVGLADDAKAAYANPAGLTVIPISEIGASSGEPWLTAAFGKKRVRVAGYAARLDEATAPVELAAAAGTGSLDASVYEAGLAAGLELHPRVRVGGTLARTRLSMEGERLLAAGGGEPQAAASVSSDDSQLRMTAGLVLLLVGSHTRSLPSLRLGVSYQPGFDWQAQLAQAGATATIDVRRPSLVSAGLAWRASDRWSFLAQGDVIRYGEVEGALERNVGGAAAAGFSLPHAVEPRLGAEFAAPLWCGCGVVRLRGGLHYRSPGTLVYEGADPALARAFSPRSWRTVASLGGSFFAEYFGKAWRLDLDSRNVFDGPELSFGIVFRF